MKKDIFKSFVAITFLFLTLLIVASLSNIKELSQKEFEKVKQKTFKAYRQESKISKDYNLPIVLIDTDGNSIKREDKTVGQIQIYDNKSGLNRLSDTPNLTSRASFKIRGNST
ncbi:hypothetical protein, partial [Paraclostridium bifermentans]|uniref:hypothetical protein n=1 Tax=Paraclostridium bifermentans TaxID=1490 RepID=UPI002FCD1AC0